MAAPATTYRFNSNDRDALPNIQAGGAAANAGDPITGNDRNFTCGFGSCGTYDPFNYQPLAQSDLLNLDFTLLNIPTLRENLDQVTSNVQRVYSELHNWIVDMEREFELKVRVGTVIQNQTLFNRLSMVIPKISQAKKAIDAWLRDFQNTVMDLSVLMQTYDEAAAKIKSLYVTTTTVMGIPQDIVKVAKQNMSKSKAIQRQMNILLTKDAQIRSVLQDITFRIKELAVGMLRYGAANNTRTLNLNSVVSSMNELGESDSPLVQIQTEMSNLINSTPINLNMNTAEVPLTQPQDITKPTVNVSEPANEQYVMDRIAHLKNSLLFTPSTMTVVEALDRHIRSRLQTSTNFQAMIDSIRSIRNDNAPNVLLEDLRRKAAQEENIYLTIDKTRSILANLKQQDRLYEGKLKETLRIAKNTVDQIHNRQLNLMDMDVEDGP